MKVELTYFKSSGKYYSSGEYETDQEHMFQIFDEVRQRMIKENLPDIHGKWITLVEVPEHEHNHPALIFPC